MSIDRQSPASVAAVMGCFLMLAAAIGCSNARPASLSASTQPAPAAVNNPPTTQFGTRQRPSPIPGGPDHFSIAFVCDASGSMTGKLDTLKHELTKAIQGLHPYQKFSITFFQKEQPTCLDRNLLPATPENKQKALHFLAGVSTAGSTDPIPGLDIAFSQHPDLLFLVTDGDFPDDQAVLREIHKLDPNHKVKINTIAFTTPADHDVDFKKLLTQLADESGGQFKTVNADDLK